MVEYDVIVLFGGVSNENEISVLTGTMACNVLKRGGKSVLPVFISQSGAIYADERLSDINNFSKGTESDYPEAALCRGGALIFNKRGKIKRRIAAGCILNCCHGGAGEGGAVSSMADIYGIPCASAGIFESSVFMNKYFTKLVLKSLGVTVAPYIYIDESRSCLKDATFPVIVKPCNLGSSIGVSKADDENGLKEALDAAFELDDSAIIEPYFADRREINCAAYFAEGKVVTSPCEEAFSNGQLLSYDDKYSGSGRRQFPADLSDEEEKYIREQTEYVYSSLNMRGIVRFDYIISGKNIYLSEINTVPGSLSYYLLSSGFGDFYGVLQSVIAQAKTDFINRSKKTLVNTGIINNFASNACKIK